MKREWLNEYLKERRKKTKECMKEKIYGPKIKHL